MSPCSNSTPGARSGAPARASASPVLGGSANSQAARRTPPAPVTSMRRTIGPGTPLVLDVSLPIAEPPDHRLSNALFENAVSGCNTPRSSDPAQGLIRRGRGEIFCGRRTARGKRSVGDDPGSSGLRVSTGEDRPRRHLAPGPSSRPRPIRTLPLPAGRHRCRPGQEPSGHMPLATAWHAKRPGAAIPHTESWIGAPERHGSRGTASSSSVTGVDGTAGRPRGGRRVSASRRTRARRRPRPARPPRHRCRPAPRRPTPSR